jgi:hypothetical protein
MRPSNNDKAFLALRGRIEEHYAMLYVADHATNDNEGALWINIDPDCPLKSIPKIVKSIAVEYNMQIIMFSIGLSDYLVYFTYCNSIYYPEIIPEIYEGNFEEFEDYRLTKSTLTTELTHMLSDHQHEERRRAKNKGR